MSQDGAGRPPGVVSLTVVREVERRALQAFSAACVESGHEGCDGERVCLDVAARAHHEAEIDNAARRFDIGAASAPFLDGQPSDRWPTVALLRSVEQLINRQPWGSDAFERSVRITASLARLGERGIPADAVIREFFGPRLRRRISLVVGSAIRAVRQGEVEARELPATLRAWMPTPMPDLPDEPGALEMWALTGPMVQQVQDWLAHGALSHVIVWRRDAERVEIDPEDLGLRGGSDATRWVFDRFTSTRLDGWRMSSLNWELGFIEAPIEVARRAGVSTSVLDERRVSVDMVTQALGRRIREPSTDDPVVADMTAIELQEQLISLIRIDATDSALAMAHRAVVARPGEANLALAYAFLQVPRDGAVAEDQLRRLDFRGVADRDIIQANLTSIRLFESDWTGVAEQLGRRNQPSESRKLAWLWSPRSLVARRVRAAEYTIDAWWSEVEMLAAEFS